ncbi:M20/M25/M40 family metallo-hydrolase [Candidatus Bathyarchaeota archaeon]|nr:M20/M25/M40 family metallo-hydrolase [Candidatus Bathyarchaeota archaeon]
MVNVDKVSKYIDTHLDQHISKVQDFLRQPSVSAENYGVRECAEILKDYLADLGCQDARLIETGSFPVVYGEYDAHAEKTLLVYMMYDTQPFAGEEWKSPPLEARLVDIEPFGKCVVARGAINSKGPLMAFLNALESILAVGEEIPVNLKFVAQGDEELGSQHFARFVEEHKETLSRADALFGPDACQDEKGKVLMGLGWKGIEYIELECSGKSWGRGPTEFGIHSSDKSWVDSPVWRMIHALATMTSKDGNKILIDGWYDNVRQPSKEDLELIDKLVETFDEESMKREMKVEKFINELHGKDLLIQYLYSTTLNIDGIWGGYTGPGSKTVLPHKVTVKLDTRLVPDQSPKQIIPKIRKHLDKHGYKDIIIRPMDPYDWSKTSVKEPIVQATIHAYRKLGYEPEIWPMYASSVPYYLFNRKPLRLPFIDAGLGYGARAHAPDEFFVIEGNERVAGLAGCEKSFVFILDTYAQYEF